MATFPLTNSFYNVAPAPGDNNTGSGARVGWYGSASCTTSNTTVSNVNVTATSQILITPVATAGGNANAPAILSQTAGSFVVNWVAFPASASIYYYVLS